MREIKFRAKDCITGEWRYGYYVHDIEWGNAYIYQQVKGPVYYEVKRFKVDEKTLGQFTGLKDKNGKEIWEGDIMTSPFWGVCIIVWNESICAFQYAYDAVGKGTAIGGRATNTLYDTDSNEFELVGNIHDNAELLKDAN